MVAPFACLFTLVVLPMALGSRHSPYDER